MSLIVLAACGGTTKLFTRDKNAGASDEQRNALEAEAQRLVRLRRDIEAVRPLHTPMGEPGAYDWLATFKEDGQTFDQYLNSNPTLPRGARRTLYVQPLGDFTDAQRRAVSLAADYMSRFFNLPVKLRPEQPLKNVPSKSRRIKSEVVLSSEPPHRRRREFEQILTGYILHDVLRPQLPADAAALIAFTSSDLYPNDRMNYLFGQASLSERVGVWSLHRLGDKNPKSENDFRLFLRRTLKIATHETGHMFSLRHCTKYECNMSGTNHLAETDRRPLDACPECMAKICWATDYDPRDRYEKLLEFCRAQGLKDEERFFEAAINALDGHRARKN